LGAAVERKSLTPGKELLVKISTTVVRQKFISVPHPDVGFNFGSVNLLRKTDHLVPWNLFGCHSSVCSDERLSL